MTYSGSPNPDPGIVKRDEETLQRQREEKVEQDRLEEERRILEEEVPYWRRQEQIEGGEFTEEPEGPHYQSIAAETGIGIATDFATVGLLGIPIVGQGLYYGTNFTVGYAANALAQWMRGDWDNFSQGEALAAGGFQTIPMGTTAKGLKGLRKAATKGALGGITMAQLEVGVDERRRLTTRELMLSGILGGTVAGGFKSAELGGEALAKNIHGQFVGLTEGLGGTGGASAMKGSGTVEPKISTNEKLKRALIKNEVIRLSPAYKGGKAEFRQEADIFDVSAAMIGGGQEDKVDALGNLIPYDRAKVTEFGATKSERRTIVFNHIKEKLRPRQTKGKQKGTGTTITRKEFNEYAQEQIKAEKDLRKAIKLLNLRSYAHKKGIDLWDYPTAESQLELVANINKAKHKPRRSKNKAGNYTETPQQFQAKVRKWQRDTAQYQQFIDYKETFDYGHIISAKTGFRVEDLGMNRISNTEIEAAHNIASYDPYTRKIIEILQEGNRERGSRRDYPISVQRMRNTAGSVVEDFVKWKANKDNDPVNLTKILDKFLPREQHENYLKFIRLKFRDRRRLGYATKKEFVEEVYEIPYKIFNEMPSKYKSQIESEFRDQLIKSGSVTGQQQFDQAGKWMVEAIDEFIGLHHYSKHKRIRSTKDNTQLNSIDSAFDKLSIDDLMEMILPDSFPNE